MNEPMTQAMEKVNTALDHLAEVSTESEAPVEIFMGNVSNYMTKMTDDIVTATGQPEIISRSLQTYGHAMLVRLLSKAIDEDHTFGQILDATRDVFHDMLKPLLETDNETDDIN